MFLCCRWEFKCDDGDIAFAVYLKKGNEMIAVVPHERVDCLNSAEEGEIACEETGLCKAINCFVEFIIIKKTINDIF